MTISLLSTGAVIATADVDMGFSQDMVDSYYRLDVKSFFFELPVEGQIDSFKLGGKMDTTFYNLYGLGAVSFDEVDNKLKPEELGLGLGYPIEFGPIKVFAEMRASSPRWLNVNSWSFTPLVGLQFSFDSLLPASAE